VNCPHCNSPARQDWACEYTCKSNTLRGRITRSPICFGNEIAQLKTRIAALESHITRLENAGMHATLPDANVIDRKRWDEAVSKRP